MRGLSKGAQGRSKTAWSCTPRSREVAPSVPQASESCSHHLALRTIGNRPLGSVRSANRRGFTYASPRGISALQALCVVRKVPTMRQKEPPRVRGPYKELRGWRLVVFEETGRRSIQFSTEAAARRKKAVLARQFERNAPRILANMLDEYIKEKIDTGRALPHIARAEQQRILCLLGDSVTRDIRHVTPAWAAGLYRELTVRRSLRTHQPLSAASHRCYLDYLKTFFGWAVQRSYVTQNLYCAARFPLHHFLLILRRRLRGGHLDRRGLPQNWRRRNC